MTTARQIAANRANAKRGTGPKTLAGKQRSSRNALRHGLSRARLLDPADEAALARLVDAIVSDNQHAGSGGTARQIGEAQLGLQRVRDVRNAFMMQLAQNPQDARLARDLLRLERYERRALTRRRKAIDELSKREGDATLGKSSRTERANTHT